MIVKRATAPVGLLMTVQTPCHTGLRAPGCTCTGFDSGRNLHAAIALATQRIAARIPGASWLQYVAKDPMTGPSIVPTFVPAESQPRERARSCARTGSAM